MTSSHEPIGLGDGSEPLTGRVRPPHGQQGISAEDITGLVKVVADSSIRLSAWAAFNGVRAARRAVAAMRDPSQAPELIEDFRTVASAVTHAVVGEGDTWVRRVGEQSPVVGAMLDVVDSMSTPSSHGVVYPGRTSGPGHSGRPGQAGQPGQPGQAGRPGQAARPGHAGQLTAEVEDPVRAHARDLLRRSRDVSERDTAHPAYLTIVKQLAPDELRILLLLLRGGPQPIVDIRHGGLGASAAGFIAKGLTMVGPMAGLRHVQRVGSYVHNLERLGLVENSREVLRDPVEYSVLEAQPDVLTHLHAHRRAKVVRRSLRLTSFGEDFLKVGVGLGDEQVGGGGEAELDAPRAAAPEVDEPAMSQLIDVEISPLRPTRPVAQPVWPSAVVESGAAPTPTVVPVLVGDTAGPSYDTGTFDLEPLDELDDTEPPVTADAPLADHAEALRLDPPETLPEEDRDAVESRS